MATPVTKDTVVPVTTDGTLVMATSTDVSSAVVTPHKNVPFPTGIRHYIFADVEFEVRFMPRVLSSPASQDAFHELGKLVCDIGFTFAVRYESPHLVTLDI